MCRHLAYVGEPIRLGALLTDPPLSLVRQSWAPRRQQHGVVNADGFGIGWYVDGLAEPARHRGAGPIWSDETFADLARVVRSTALMAAVRSATVGMAGGQAAPRRSGPGRGCSATTAPSTAGHRWPAGWPGASIRARWRYWRRRPIRRCCGRLPCACWPAAKPPEAALAEVVGQGGGGRWRPADVAAHRRSRITATAWGTSLCWRRLPGGVVVASEPYDDDPSWVDVPDRSLLVADADRVNVSNTA